MKYILWILLIILTTNLMAQDEAEDLIDSSVSESLNEEMDFIEQKTKDVTLFLESTNSDEVNVTNSAINRSPAIIDDQPTDEDLINMLGPEKKSSKRRVRSR